MDAKAISLMKELAKNEPEHLCYSCVNAYHIAVVHGELIGTTQDINACDLFENDLGPWMARGGESGNDRLSWSGIRTKDNGSGYHVADCPHYRNIWR